MISLDATNGLAQALGANWVLVLVGVLIILLLGCLIGYLIGNTSLRSKVSAGIDALERDMQIQKAVLDNVGLGIAVYDKSGAIFCNETIFKLPEFLKGGLPKTLDKFLETFDNDNQLKSNYILSCENGINVVRVNYCVGPRIYEIKIIRRLGDSSDKYFAGEELHIVIVDDITQIKDDERRQKDLAANVSHELKTPLTSINTSVFSILRASEGGAVPDRNDLITWSARIQENSIRMQDIVNDFLVLSQCSHTSRMGIFDISEVVSQAYANITDYPGSKNVTFTLPEDNPYPLVYGNQKLVIRAVINLLTNAVKYISYDGKTAPDQIHISISVIDDRVAVQVEDNGRGIPAKDIDHLFERFYRVDNSGSREVGGSGIGLAIAKEIAEMHDGVISVTSILGQGATFTLSLPTGKTVFSGVYADSQAGIISDKPLYRAAAYFLGLQECEAVKSLGYDDLDGVVSEYESIEDTDVPARDKALTTLLKAFGQERFTDLTEELLYVEDYEDGDDSPVTGLAEEEFTAPSEPEAVKEDGAEIIEQAEQPEQDDEASQAITAEAPAPIQSAEPIVTGESVPVMESIEKLLEEEPESSEAPQITEEAAPQEIPQEDPETVRARLIAEQQAAEEEKRLQAKEEARKLLTQPVVQISAEQKKPVSSLKKESMQKKVIHPIDTGKRYNKRRASSPDDGKAAKDTEKSGDITPKPESKSALKKMLDDSNPHL